MARVKPVWSVFKGFSLEKPAEVGFRQLQHQVSCSEGQLSRASEQYRPSRHVAEQNPWPNQPRLPPVVNISTSTPVSLTFNSPGHTVVIHSTRPASHPWLFGFLCGGGCAAAGFAAYGLGPQQAHLTKLSKEEGWPFKFTTPWSLFGLGTAKAADLVPSAAYQLPMPWATDSSTAATTAAADGSPDSISTSNAAFMRSSISEAASKAAPAVVHMVVPHDRSNGMLGGGGLFDTSSTGSGFIYDSRGYILTNAHVVVGAAASTAFDTTDTTMRSARTLSSSTASSNGSSSHKPGGSSRPPAGGGLLVHLPDGRVFDGQVVALDRPSDLAVVRIHADDPLPTARLGSSTQLRVGEWVIALGSPLHLKQSVTAGIISCVERKGSELGIHTARTEFIQTDAAVNQGNSGGPLINLDGEVIGVNNMKAVAADGVSFAIPIDMVKEMVSEMSRFGRVRRPYVGITMAEINPSRMRQLQAACPGFPSHVRSAIVVTRVTPGSPAAAAGLREDDVIVGVGGKQQAGIAGLADALKAHIGQQVELDIVRQQQVDKHASNGANGGDIYSNMTVKVQPVEAPAAY